MDVPEGLVSVMSYDEFPELFATCRLFVNLVTELLQLALRLILLLETNSVMFHTTSTIKN